MDPRDMVRQPFMRLMVVDGNPSAYTQVIMDIAVEQGWKIPHRSSLFNKAQMVAVSDFSKQRFRSRMMVQPKRSHQNWEIEFSLDDSWRSTVTGDLRKAAESMRTVHTLASERFARDGVLVGSDPEVHYRVSLTRPAFEFLQAWSP